MIKHKSFKHGWFYYYRVHTAKCEMLLNEETKPLHDYLMEMFENCPDEHFIEHPRSSAIKFRHDFVCKRADGHEVCQLAQIADEYSNRYKSAHSRVEVSMLENDDKTIAVEVPLWLHSDELDVYRDLFETEKPLSGHIDLLRIEDDNIYVWDYKPNAVKEKYATLQVLFYSYMLSKRTGIPLERFRCGYFDEESCFVFKPDTNMMSELAKKNT